MLTPTQLQTLQSHRWLIGVSGGGDSIALLHMLLPHLKPNQLTVACFNHNWSTWGTEATTFVQTLCQQHNLPFLTTNGQGRGAHNAEEIARHERINWFAALCHSHSLHGTILAHTQTDNIETFLMRAGKGSGLQGLACMAEHTHLTTINGPLHLWRPLLNTSRETLRAYLKQHNQPHLEDPSNLAASSQRAKIRKLLPQLEKAGIPAHGIAASIASLQRANAALQNHTQTLSEQIHNLSPTSLKLNLLWFKSIPIEHQIRLLATCQNRLLGVADTQISRTSKRLELLKKLENSKGKATLGPLQYSWNQTHLTITPQTPQKTGPKTS